jgi:hypothetical protein
VAMKASDSDLRRDGISVENESGSGAGHGH